MSILLKQKNFLLLTALWLLVILFLSNHTVLWDEDEAAYAGFAKTMVETGNWFNPDFLWAEFHKKPPLHFWTIAVSYSIFGVSEWATRLPSILSFLLTLASVFFLGRKIFGEEKATWAVLVLASSLFLPSLAKIAFTDSTLLFFETSAVLALLLFLKQPNWKWALLFWSMVALGIMVKGPPILILSFGLGGFLVLFHPERKRLLQAKLWLFFPLALLPILAWGYASYQQDGGKTVDFLLDWYIYKRLNGDGHVYGQTGPPGYHFVFLMVSFLPWFGFLFPVFPNLYKKLREKDATAIIMAGWLLFGWFFYELMASKLPTYSIAAAPAFAFLIANEIVARQQTDYPRMKSFKTGVVFYFILSFFLIFALLFSAYWMGGSSGLAKAVIPLTLCWGLSIAVAPLLFAGRIELGAKGAAAFGMLVTTVVWLVLVPIAEPARSASKRLANRLTELANQDYTVVLGAGSDFKQLPSLPFYISEHYDNYYFEKMLEQAQIDYEKNDQLIFVMGDYWLERWEREWQEQGKTLGLKEKVEGWQTDHMKASSYWIVRKANSK